MIKLNLYLNNENNHIGKQELNEFEDLKKQQKTDPKVVPTPPQKVPPSQVTAPVQVTPPSFNISLPPSQPQVQETLQTFPLDNDPKVRKNYVRKSETHGKNPFFFIKKK